MNNKTVIRAENIVKNYHDGEKELHILKGLDLNVNESESVAIIGRSGTGKSTFLNTIGLLDHPTSGRIFLNGTETTALSDRARTRIRGQEIGFVFQQYHLLGDLTALDNVLISGNFSRKNNGRKFALELLDKVGLKDRIRHKPAALSGGEQQRVAIARALFSRPAILLCDEPTGNLDPQSGTEIMSILFSIVEEQRAAMILVSHDHELALNARKAFVLTGGILQECSKKEITIS